MRASVRKYYEATTFEQRYKSYVERKKKMNERFNENEPIMTKEEYAKVIAETYRNCW